MIQLSVITMFCDGTEDLLDKWVTNANEKIAVTHELIVVDNTTEQTIPRSDKYKLVQMGRNAMQFAGRRAGVYEADGEYVWLVDNDDIILPLKHWEWDEDLICFNYLGSEIDSDKVFLCDKSYPLSYTASKTDFFKQVWHQAQKNMVWNKFYKKDVLLKTYSKLPEGLEFSFMEDTLLNILNIANVQSIRFETTAYYHYHIGTGISTKKMYRSMAQLKRVISGLDIAFGIFSMAIPKRLQEESGIQFMPLYRGAALYYLCKYEFVAPELIEQYTELLHEYFDKQILLDVLKECSGKTIDRKLALKVKHYINDYITEEAQNA